MSPSDGMPNACAGPIPDVTPQVPGDRLTCIFVDNGLLRYDEASQIKPALASANAVMAMGLVSEGPCGTSAACPCASRAAASSITGSVANC